MKILDFLGLTELVELCKETFASITHKHTLNDITDYTVDSTFSSTSTNPIQNKVVNNALVTIADDMDKIDEDINKINDEKADKTELPTKVSQLENDSNYATNEDVTTALHTSQSDWSQSNESSADYIKNKPFYEETIETGEVETLYEGSYTFSAMFTLPETIYNDVLYVTFNEENYTLTRHDINPIEWDYHSTDGTELPFSLYYDGLENEMYFDLFGYEFTTDKVDVLIQAPVIETNIVQLDEKFIPDTIARSSDLESLSDKLDYHSDVEDVHMTDERKTQLTNAYTHSTNSNIHITSEEKAALLSHKDDVDNPHQILEKIEANSDLVVTELGDEIVGDSPELDPVVESRISEIETEVSSLKSDLAELESEVSEQIAETKAHIVQQTPSFPEVNDTLENALAWLKTNGDTSKVYVLPNGYIYGYFKSEKAVGGYTNQIPISTDAGGNIYNDIGYKNGYRFNSSYTEGTQTGSFITGFIPVKPGDTIRLNGNYIDAESSLSSSLRHLLYKSDKTTRIGAILMGATEKTGQHFSAIEVNESGYVTSFTISENWDYVSNWGELAYIRLNLLGSGEDCIITVNEEIKESVVVVTYDWANTNHAFVPNDYEDDFIQINEKVDKFGIKVTSLENAVKKTDEAIEALEAKIENAGSTEIPDYWQTAINLVKTKIDEIYTNGGVDCVSSVCIGDLHARASMDEKGKRLGLVAKTIMDESDIPLLIAVGDIMSQASHTSPNGIYEELGLARKWFSPIPYEQQALIMGNHDGAWGDTTTGYYTKQLPLEVVYNLIYRKQAMDMKRVSGGNGTYYYIDNASQKHYFIMLNSNNTPDYEENEDGTAKYDRFHASCLGQTQLDWLVDVLSNMPKDYTASIYLHEPYVGDYPQLISVVDTYNNRGICNSPYADTDYPWRSSHIKADFTNANGEIVGVVAGHVHFDYMRYVGHNPMYLTCPLITLTTALGGDARQSPDGETLSTSRTDGTATEFAFDIQIIDKKNRKWHMIRLGAGSNREVSY